ncbi:hypothetical protein [Parerythrobacter jejuensis]|uniref:Lipoprotein n=1 Tax=Parerythrobacter jejuensis TaxID=795812 RepID=A0A845ANB5_9SPHN|nr:hypothetical protein [Parerythrobacter jejuensis]MXP30927.1 hypothetical protein [Parerythrobacter jejuensis]MXP33687.1 hypothetical protein [Parerythrobacter jejuensis]
MRPLPIATLLFASLALQGCLAASAIDLAGKAVTAPVKIASKGVDLATTSQSEADEKRGRDLRKREERLGKLERRYDKERADCAEGDRGACEDARATYDEIRDLLPTVPVEPDDD